MCVCVCVCVCVYGGREGWGDRKRERDGIIINIVLQDTIFFFLTM